MDMTILALLFGGFLGGLLVTSRTLAWLAGLHAALHPKTDAIAGRSVGHWVVPLLLHSGPWLLLVTAGVVRYEASLRQPEFLWALVGGLAAAIVFIGAMAYRTPSRPRPPLTPERLGQIRREFFLANIALFGIATAAIAAWDRWNTLDRDYPIVIICALCAPLGGWLYSLVMWQWYGTALEVAEKKRRQREAREPRETAETTSRATDLV